ncbi:unnamed protein product [Calicophoron daubneyi]|uniref:Protein LLP homolog n=1 Tax=Calicophoron daubneyi TaxID=300641 RepID=A0AAV2T833_CALDB
MSRSEFTQLIVKQRSIFSYLMAKSIRSKSKRKFRALKRRKTWKKVEDQLKKVSKMDVKLVKLPFVTREDLEAAVDDEKDKTKGDILMNDIENMTPKDPTGTVVTRKNSLMNEHGNFPVWMNKKEKKRHVRLYRLKKRNKRG